MARAIITCTMSEEERARILEALIFGAESIVERLDATEEELEGYGEDPDAETADYLEAGRRNIETLKWFAGKLEGG